MASKLGLPAQGFGLALLQQLLRSGLMGLVFLFGLWFMGQRMPWEGGPVPATTGLIGSAGTAGVEQEL
jgi:hypothetical protein